MEKIRIAEKSLLDQFCAVWILYSDIFLFANIPYFNFQINFQSSHLTKKETEDASKRLLSYCMGALNSYQPEFLFIQDNVYNHYRKIFYHLLHQWMKI